MCLNVFFSLYVLKLILILRLQLYGHFLKKALLYHLNLSRPCYCYFIALFYHSTYHIYKFYNYLYYYLSSQIFQTSMCASGKRSRINQTGEYRTEGVKGSLQRPCEHLMVGTDASLALSGSVLLRLLLALGSWKETLN